MTAAGRNGYVLPSSSIVAPICAAQRSNAASPDFAYRPAVGAIFEAMRGHLVGPERTGDFELIETEDRYILRFDPCGSGGRTIRGDWIEDTPARMEPPYDWKVTEE